MSKARIALLICLLQVLTFSHPTVGASKTLVTIAYQGPLTGPEASTGIDQLNAVNYAVSKFNAVSSAYQVKVIQVDDQGDPVIAGKVAPGVAKNSQIIGLVGPAYSGATIASLPFYKAGGLAMISPSASRVSLTDSNSDQFGGPIFHRVALSEERTSPNFVAYATKGVLNPKVFIIDDQSWYPSLLAGYVTAGLKKVSGAMLVGTDSIQNVVTDFSATIAKIKAANTNVIIYTGYYSQAAVFIKQLRDSGSKAIFVGGDGVANQEFPKLAGNAAEGARIVAYGSDSINRFYPKLETDFKKTVRVSSGVYSIEAIDATNIFLKCISEGNIKRATILSCVKSYKGTSLNGDSISFSANGDVLGKTPYLLEVRNGSIVSTNVSSIYYLPDFKTKIQETPEPAGISVGSSTKKEILCLRGTITKKLRSANPVCPPGYSQKGQ